MYGLRVTYLLSNNSLLEGPWRGMAPGRLNTYPPTFVTNITLGPDEYVAKISGAHDENGFFISQLNITTVGPYARRKYGTFGYLGDKNFVFHDSYTLAFHGRADGMSIYALGIYKIDYTLKSSIYYCPNLIPSIPTYAFENNLESVPPVMGISKLNIWHDSLVNGIQVEFILLGGGKRLSGVYGDVSHARPLTTLTLDKGEQIVELWINGGYFYHAYLNQIALTTVKPGGAKASYGPFGTFKGVTNYTLQGNIYGFMGCSQGQWLYALGVKYDNASARVEPAAIAT